jgi:hypothetical protein
MMNDDTGRLEAAQALSLWLAIEKLMHMGWRPGVSLHERGWWAHAVSCATGKPLPPTGHHPDPAAAMQEMLRIAEDHHEKTA